MSTSSSPPRKMCAILLAAGRGSRFADASTHKLLADLRGRPVFAWALDTVLAAGFADVVVVTGAATLDLPTGVHVAENPRWQDGQATSLQRGVDAAATLGHDAVVVGLADQPFITRSAWQHVAASDADIAVATYPDGRGGTLRGNPVLLRRAIWALLPSEGDQGARSLMTRRPDLVAEVACSGSPADIDTMEDLQQWNSSTNSP